jgi:hypothetical protein
MPSTSSSGRGQPPAVFTRICGAHAPGSRARSGAEALEREPGIAYAAPVVFGDAHRGFPVVGSTVDFVTRGESRLERVFESEEVVLGADVGLPIGASFTPAHGRPADRDDGVRASTPDSPMSLGRLARSGIRGPGHHRPSRPVAVARAPHRPCRGCSGSDRPGTKSGWRAPAIIKPPIGRRRVPVARRYRTRRWRSFPPRCCSRCTLCLATRETSCGCGSATQALVGRFSCVRLAEPAPPQSASACARRIAPLRVLAVWLHVSFLVRSDRGRVLLGWGGACALSAVLRGNEPARGPLVDGDRHGCLTAAVGAVLAPSLPGTATASRGPPCLGWWRAWSASRNLHSHRAVAMSGASFAGGVGARAALSRDDDDSRREALVLGLLLGLAAWPWPCRPIARPAAATARRPPKSRDRGRGNGPPVIAVTYRCPRCRRSSSVAISDLGLNRRRPWGREHGSRHV